MLGRAEEAARVAALVRDAVAGRSGALLVVGEPGIGKTVLLGHARAVAQAEGALLLEAWGAEGEAHLPFAGLSDLLRPVLGLLDAVPGPQADALRGALALGPPRPGDRFTTYAATLSLLAAAAEDRPVVCIIDDAHWLDAESFEAVQFAARRLGAEGVAILMAARDGLSERVDAWPLERLRLAGLAGDEARALIAEHATATPGPHVLDALVAGAKGNPLALMELAVGLSPEQLAGAEPLPDPLPVGPYLRDALLRPMRALPEATRRALLVLSAGDGATAFLAAALAAEGLSPADLEPAVRAGVIAVGTTHVLFSHPLVRAAVYRGAAAAERRSAHRAYAAAAAAIGEAALDRRAWHLALAAGGPDEATARELVEAARRGAARSGHLGAAQAFEAAARLTADPRPRGAPFRRGRDRRRRARPGDRGHGRQGLRRDLRRLGAEGRGDPGGGGRPDRRRLARGIRRAPGPGGRAHDHAGRLRPGRRPDRPRPGSRAGGRVPAGGLSGRRRGGGRDVLQ